MQTFIMLTRLISEEVNPSFAVSKKEEEISEKVKKYCPDVEWVKNYAILGSWDFLDIFHAPNIDVAMKVSSIARYYGGAHTEIWPAIGWEKFANSMRNLAEVMEKE